MSTLLRKICSNLQTRRYIYLSHNACPRMFSSGHRAVPTEEHEQSEHTTKGGIRYVVRSLTHGDLPTLLSLARDMQSIDCVSCLHSWLEADPHGIKVAITSTGEIAGSCCSVMNGDHDEDGVCFGGVFFVQKKYQSQGIGQNLWSSCFKHIGKRNGALNAVPGKLAVYRDSGGFPLHDPRFTSLEYHTTSWPLDFSSFSDVPPPGVEIRLFDPSHLSAIFAYDKNLVGFRRTTTMRLNLFEEGSRSLVAFGKSGAVAGFGTVKLTCLGAVRVGPLYADDPEVAEVLLKRLVGMHEDGKGFSFVTTSANSVAVEWMDRLGVKAREECDRLYIKRVLDVDLSKIFAQFDINFAPF